MAKTLAFGTALRLKESYGYLSGAFNLPFFAEAMGAKQVRARVEIEVDDEASNDLGASLTEPIRAGIDWLAKNEKRAANAVTSALRAKFPELGPKLGPKVSLIGVKFHDAVNGKEPYIGFEFNCRWDSEHGLGLMMHGTRVVELGGADTAILEWIADRDARKARRSAKKKPPLRPAKAKPKTVAKQKKPLGVAAASQKKKPSPAAKKPTARRRASAKA